MLMVFRTSLHFGWKIEFRGYLRSKIDKKAGKMASRDAGGGFGDARGVFSAPRGKSHGARGRPHGVGDFPPEAGE